MKLPINPTEVERKLVRAIEVMDQDYQKLKRENAALRDEIYALRQQLPTVIQALAESPAEFVAGFVEI